MQFLFADHTLDIDRRELLRGSAPIAVAPQVFDLLVYLVRNRDRVVSKDDLIASVWSGRIVSDSTLTPNKCGTKSYRRQRRCSKADPYYSTQGLSFRWRDSRFDGQQRAGTWDCVGGSPCVNASTTAT